MAGGHRPGGLLAQLRTAAPAGDAFLFGGRRTPEAFMVLGAIEMLEVLQFPALLAEGVPFSPPDSPQRHLRLEQQHTFPDGTSHHAYVVATEPTTRT